MRYTIKFGTYFGIPVRVHFTFPLILLAFGVDGWRTGGWGEAVWAVSLVMAVFACVVLHEFGHSLQVRRYGIQVHDIVLLPIGGMARAERIPENPRQEIIVAISGPLVNFVLAALFFVILWLQDISIGTDEHFLVNLLGINIVLGTFNLIPAFPMDGGRILRGLLAIRMPYLRATRYAKGVGQIIAIIFALLGFADQRFIMLPLIAVFIFFGAISEERMIRVKIGLDKRCVRDFVAPIVPISSTAITVDGALALLAGTGLAALPVTDGEGSRSGAVLASDLEGARGDGMGADTVERFVHTGFPLIEAGTPAIHAYYMLRSNKQPVAGIVEGGKFIGLMFLDDVTRAIA
ncbi:MAG: site-2 protease family protein [Candidatus Krumholzibacteriia bacterium]